MAKFRKKNNKSFHRKNQWTDFYDDVETQSCDEWEMKQDIQAQWDEFHQAILQNNADHLNDLLPPISSSILLYCI
ncbi:hypothetical protein I4U23_010997 [Adineta vaga]|nr:hypothetical protein I4U23_010997 [Adineta vaga]